MKTDTEHEKKRTIFNEICDAQSEMGSINYHNQYEAIQKMIKDEMKRVRTIIEKKMGRLKAFRDFPLAKKGDNSGMIFMGRLCPSQEIYDLYHKYSKLCLELG